MKVMVVGGGGREHAIIRKLKENETITELYALPGNGGIAQDAICVNIGAKDIEAQVAFAKENGIDFAVVAPDDPLVLGAVDALTEAGIPCFGPSKAAAQIEGSKVFSKNLMKKYGIPTASCEVFDNLEEAIAYVKKGTFPTVIKADGLALGKGVIIAQTEEEAIAALHSMMEDKVFGESGSRVVIEEFLTGPEVSVLAFTDGKTVKPMVSSMDHKRALDGDKGLNTGGMGTIAPNPYYTEDVADRCMQEIFLPTISAMAEEGCPFKGCLYFGLMLTPNGPKVIEYNCRFGDPETQVVLPLLESDLFEIMQAVANETLSDMDVKWRDGSACCVIMASNGYPASYEKGFEIKVDEDFAGNLYVAGATLKDGTLYTNGGRVLGVVATADTLGEAIEKAYGEVEHVHFDNAFFRRDIGKSAMKAKGESQSMVYRIYSEKKPEQANEAKGLLSDLKTFLGIEGLTGLRLINRYDVENIEKEDFDRAIPTIFSEPPTDDVFGELETGEGAFVFAVSFLPGQFDMRADSAAQCIQLMTQKERPTVRYAKVYVLEGELSEEDIAKIKKYVINPVESGEVTLEKFDTLQMTVTAPEDVPTLDGFINAGKEEIAEMVKSYGLAMDEDDLLFCQSYFKKEERRDPTLTELRVIDTYWSDHCRHTTFLTEIDQVTFEDEELQSTYESYLAAREELKRTKPVTLMDIGTLAAKYLKSKGMLDKLDESEEINACTVKTTVKVNGEEIPYLLLFKNETHNHPTEIEPFGGAATCIGGAIRDPLSGRSYVYAAMRVTGAADPTKPLCETIEGKLPQRKLVATAAAGYSSYGNQIGLATGQVDELYHDGYVAKHMEIGAVLGAAPAANVRREVPKAGDAIILLGGKTGRDGCGGATGSSKSHTVGSLTECGAEVQKGNAPEERKLQRLFRNPEATSMIVRCNDFGAGGVSVAVGELADGLFINLNCVPKKYEGLSGTELAISESQERMAVVVAKADVPRFMKLAKKENLEATQIAEVLEKPRLVMHHNGKQIVSLSREFLNSNGAKKHITVEPPKSEAYAKAAPESFAQGYNALLSDLNVCSKRGLSERFDSTIGTGSVLMPFGGKKQLSPIQTMIHRIPTLEGITEDCSAMAWGYNPFIAEKAPYHSAYLAVVESVSKLIAAGASFEDVYLTFQEYFAKPGKDPKRWGVPFASLLGAYRAQVGLGVAAIGGKDSMSGSFEQIDVPPTLVSFAVTTLTTGEVITSEFKEAGNAVVWLKPALTETGLPETESLKALYAQVKALMDSGKVKAAYTPTFGGVAEAVFKMAVGAGIGFAFDENVSLTDLFGYAYGSFVLELSKDAEEVGTLLGYTKKEEAFTYGEESLSLADMQAVWEEKLESVYPTNAASTPVEAPQIITSEKEGNLAPRVRYVKPKVLIPVFPGTNCEYDTARAAEAAGAVPEIFVINNLTPASIAESAAVFAKKLASSQMLFIPGGFSGGDEPDGSGKFITAFLREAHIAEELSKLLEQRDGLVCGICNGFQALIKLGLVPYGKITEPSAEAPTLTYNLIGRHQSRLVETRVCANHSPWLSETKVGEIYTVPISHGEGRFLCSDEVLKTLIENGQVATQYVDASGAPTYDIRFNPNGSTCAIEGITSLDGRVLGKMGHTERTAQGLYKNVPGEYDMKLFQGAVKYYK